MPLFLGLDCGGSSSRAMVRNKNQEIIFQSESGPANLASTPQEKLNNHLKEVLSDCPKVDSCVGCFAGLLTNDDKVRATHLLSQFVKSKHINCVPDFHAVVASAPQSQAIVISGTGSIVASRQNGNIIKSGGGGALISDIGSTYDIASRSLWLTQVRADKLPVTKKYKEALQTLFGASDGNELLAKLYQHPTPVAQLAKLCKTVIDDYLLSQEYATMSVDQALNGLATELHDHIRIYLPNQKEISIALAGGLWETSHELQSVFQSVVDQSQSRNPDSTITLCRPEQKPIDGAVNLAEELYTQYH